LNIFNS